MRKFFQKIENTKFSLPLIISLGLIVRIILLAIKPDIISPDVETYYQAGEDLFSKGIINSPKVMPLFPIIIYSIGKGFGIKLFNIICGTFIIFLSYQLALNTLHSRLIALFSALFTAIYPFYIYISATGLSEPLYSALVYLALILLYLRKYALCFAIAAISILVRPFFELIFPIILVLFLYFEEERDFRFIFKQFCKYLLIYSMVMTPWWIHNHKKYNQFVRLTTSLGISFYVGNNIEENFKYGINFGPKGEIYHVPQDIQNRAGGDPVKRSQLLKQEFINFVKNRPSEFIKRVFIKLARLYRPAPDNSNFGKKPLYKLASYLSYLPIMILALISLFLLNRALYIRLIPIWLMISYTTAVHCLTIGNIRYRLPIDFFFIILAAYSMILIYKKLEHKKGSHENSSDHTELSSH